MKTWYNHAMKRLKRYIIDGSEFLLAFLFIQGGIRVLGVDELPDVPGALRYLTSQDAIYFYGVLWILTGIGLAYSKICRKKAVHGLTLMIMYLSCVYVLVLGMAINGIHWRMLTTLGISFLSGGLYLRWRYRNYVPKEDETTGV